MLTIASWRPPSPRRLGHDEDRSRIFIDADRAAKHDDEIGSEEAFNVEALDARIMVADIVAAVGEKRTEQADILEGDVADREALRRVFGHARQLS